MSTPAISEMEDRHDIWFDRYSKTLNIYCFIKATASHT